MTPPRPPLPLSAVVAFLVLLAPAALRPPPPDRDGGVGGAGTTTAVAAFSSPPSSSPSPLLRRRRSLPRHGLLLRPRPTAPVAPSRRPRGSSLAPPLGAARYGPPETSGPTDEDDDAASSSSGDRSSFASLLRSIADGSLPPEERPGAIASKVDSILGLVEADGRGGGRILEEIATEVAEETDGGGDEGERLERASLALEEVLSFVEAFVRQTSSADDGHKKLLGRIFEAMGSSRPERTSEGGGGSRSATAAAAGEDELDDLLSREADAFTPGFLRHVEGECERLAGLPTVSPESARMTQVLRLIQARVLEELGKDIGEGAVVLGQLLGYDDLSERHAVLDAGLAVRGPDFAREMLALTEEALEGFRGVPGGADPGLVRGVEGIDERIRKFLEERGGEEGKGGAEEEEGEFQ